MWYSSSRFTITKNLAYSHNILTLKRYNDDKYRLVYNRCQRRPNYESRLRLKHFHYDSKMDESISRTKKVIRELALCNTWDFFFTGTIDPEKYDRYNLANYIKDLSQFIRDKRKKYGLDIKYLLLPEQHKNGAWHVHGLLSGISEEMLYCYKLTDKLPLKMIQFMATGENLYDWQEYTKKFGWCTLSKVRSSEAVSKYISKYITKDVYARSRALGANLYYCSQRLQRAEVVQSIEIEDGAPPDDIWSFENSFCKVVELEAAALGNVKIIFQNLDAKKPLR